MRVSEIGSRDQILARHRLAGEYRLAQVPVEHLVCPGRVLAEEALVQVVTSPEGVDRGGVGGVAADQCCHRPARHQLSQKENHDGQHEQQRDQHEHSP